MNKFISKVLFWIYFHKCFLCYCLLLENILMNAWFSTKNKYYRLLNSPYCLIFRLLLILAFTAIYLFSE